MVDIIKHKVSLAGQVVEDLTYSEVEYPRFTAEFSDQFKSPLYKRGGYFLFTNLANNQYRLRLGGEEFRPEVFNLTIPLGNYFFEQPGDNELVVVVNSTANGGTRILFDDVLLTREIRKGSAILGTGFTALLAESLPVGLVNQAKMDNLSGPVTVGGLLRLVRDKSIRLRYNPYSTVPNGLSRVVGKIVAASAPELALADANVRVSHINSVAVTVENIAGANIVTVMLAGKKVVLGTDKDLSTRTNSRGDFNIYFQRGDFLTGISLEISLTGYQTETPSVSIAPGERKIVNIQLQKN